MPEVKEVVTVEVKPWYESRTIWANVGMLALALATFLLDQQRAGVLPFVVDENWLMFFISFYGVVNVWLRTITEAPVTGGSKG